MPQSNALADLTLEHATVVAPPRRGWSVRRGELVAMLLEFGTEDTFDSERRNRRLRRLALAILAGLTLAVAIMILAHTLATNDGPVHLAFSNLLLSMHEPGHPMQQQAYTVHLHPNPNLVVYLLMVGLMRFFSASFVESLVQILCIAGPIAAGYFALRMIQPKNAWLAIFLLPMSLNQTLFFGLYNHCLSTAAFFLAVGCYYWMTKAPSIWRAAALSGALVLTFFCHASGFIMATTGIWTLSATAAVLSFRRHRRAGQAVWEQRHALLALAAQLPLVALFLVSGEKSITEYGVDVFHRLKQFAELHVLSIHYPTWDRFAAALLSLLLLSAFAVVSVRIVVNRRELPRVHRDQAMGAIAATVVTFAIMMAFPDKMGGGWTHFRRFEVFPYFFMLLTLAFDRFATRALGWFVATSTSVALFLIGSMAIRQAGVREQIAPLAAVDQIVADHCTVLPIALEYGPVLYDDIDWMDYQPFFQSASRLELHGDRVVLFNYLARLSPYPVHFYPRVEPQAYIFHWQPSQSKTTFERVDVPGFERASGMTVDYILVWGNPARRTAGMQAQVRNALTHFSPVYRSPNGRVLLYQRQDVHNTYCQANSSTVAAGNFR